MEATEIDWQALDDLIMEKIFEALPKRDRFNASLVCRRWSSCFELPKVWRTIHIDGLWLTKCIVIDDANDEQCNRVLDYDRVTNCLHKIGQHIRNIYIRQRQHFVSLYQLFVLFVWHFDKKVFLHGTLFGSRHQCFSQFNTVPLQTHTMQSFTPANIQKFSFEFPCDQPLAIQQNGVKLFGIGGNKNRYFVIIAQFYPYFHFHHLLNKSIVCLYRKVN